MTTLLLASASPARLSTLRSAGIEPVVRVSGVDEDAVLEHAAASAGAPLHPADAVLALARAKADAVVTSLRADSEADGDDGAAGDAGAQRLDAHGAPLPDDLVVLGCDSLLELDGEPLGKPTGPADAVERWRRMRGRSGVLHTGHWLVDTRDGATGSTGATASTLVHFADLSDAEIDAYVATGEPLAVAGAFTIDGLGGPFVTGLEGDHHTVVGLSLPLLRDLLARLGVGVPELWATAGTGGVAGPSPQTDPGASASDSAGAAADESGSAGAAARTGPAAAGVVWRTPRLVIRSMGAEHARSLAAYRSEPEVARYQSWDAPFTLAQARAFVAGMAGVDPVSPGRWVQLAIEADGAHVGDVAVRVDEDGRQARVGITLAGDAQGRGWGTEALGAVLDGLFAAGLHRVVADCDVRNEASWRLLERIGMRREAHHRRSSFWKGEWVDEYEYAVLAEEWRG